MIEKKKRKKKKQPETAVVAAEGENAPQKDTQIFGTGNPPVSSLMSFLSRNLFAFAVLTQLSHTDGKPIDPTAISVMGGKTYEQEFGYELEKLKVGILNSLPIPSITSYEGVVKGQKEILTAIAEICRQEGRPRACLGEVQYEPPQKFFMVCLLSCSGLTIPLICTEKSGTFYMPLAGISGVVLCKLPLLKSYYFAGYSAPIIPKTASQRLDVRSASRSDKFCK